MPTDFIPSHTLGAMQILEGFSFPKSNLITTSVVILI